MTRAAALVMVLLPAVALAAPVELPKTKALLDVPASCTRVERPGLVAAYTCPDGLAVAVTRAQVPNPDAWRTKTRDAYFDQITRGAIAAAPGLRQTARRISDANGVPALDLELRRADGAALVIRILAFRTYALAATVEVPKGVALDEARAITTRFAPPRA
ncbi:MAG: hypothetical protein ABI867_41135 [Kofleriaceae bacterium]